MLDACGTWSRKTQDRSSYGLTTCVRVHRRHKHESSSPSDCASIFTCVHHNVGEMRYQRTTPNFTVTATIIELEKFDAPAVHKTPETRYRLEG